MQQRFPENPVSINDNLTITNEPTYFSNLQLLAYASANIGTIISEYLNLRGIHFQAGVDIMVAGRGANGSVFKINNMDIAVALMEEVIQNGVGVMFGRGSGKIKDFTFSYNPTESYASLFQIVRKGMTDHAVHSMKSMRRKPKSESGKPMMALKIQLLTSAEDVENVRHENAVHAMIASNPDTSHLVPTMYAAGTLRVPVMAVPGTLVAIRATFMQFVAPSYVTLQSMTKNPRMAKSKASRNKLYCKVRDAFIDLWAAGYAHGDAHDENIVVNNKTKHVCIYDFGFAVKLEPALHDVCKNLKAAKDRGAPKDNLNRFFDAVATAVDRYIEATIRRRYNSEWFNSDVLLLKSMHMWVDTPAREIHAYKILAPYIPQQLAGLVVDLAQLNAYKPVWF